MTCPDAWLVKTHFTLIHNEALLAKLRSSIYAASRFWQGWLLGCICLSDLRYETDALLEKKFGNSGQMG